MGSAQRSPNFPQPAPGIDGRKQTACAMDLGASFSRNAPKPQYVTGRPTVVLHADAGSPHGLPGISHRDGSSLGCSHT